MELQPRCTVDFPDDSAGERTATVDVYQKVGTCNWSSMVPFAFLFFDALSYAFIHPPPCNSKKIWIRFNPVPPRPKDQVLFFQGKGDFIHREIVSRRMTDAGLFDQWPKQSSALFHMFGDFVLLCAEVFTVMILNLLVQKLTFLNLLVS